MKRILFFSVPLLVALNLFAKEVYIDPGPNAQERLQEALILIEEGDTLIIKSGYYKFEENFEKTPKDLELELRNHDLNMGLIADDYSDDNDVKKAIDEFVSLNSFKCLILCNDRFAKIEKN